MQRVVIERKSVEFVERNVVDEEKVVQTLVDASEDVGAFGLIDDSSWHGVSSPLYEIIILRECLYRISLAVGVDFNTLGDSYLQQALQLCITVNQRYQLPCGSRVFFFRVPSRSVVVV